MKAIVPNTYRDSWCASVTKQLVGEQKRVAGWVHRRRDHGGLIFIDLRDRSGIVQLVFNPDGAGQAHADAHRLRSEDVLTAVGEVVQRSEQNINPDLVTGEVEIAVESFELLADAETPPFQVDENDAIDEGVRLTNRAIDLRREHMADAIKLRHRVISTMRSQLEAEDFLEIETPILTKSTPEGARDFLVPSRQSPGSWYALPQSPQLFKQLLMMSGFERYYQVARCFRDEDLRADRQPEFTQLDLEMSFVKAQDVITTVERTLTAVFNAAEFTVPPAPWPQISYDESLRRFGNDRPDTRFDLELKDLAQPLSSCEFKVFSGALSSGGAVFGINAGPRELSRADLDSLTEEAKELGAKGLVWAFVEDGGSWRSPIAKFLSEDEVSSITTELGGQAGDLLLIVADDFKTTTAVLGGLRQRIAERYGLIPEGVHNPLWVVDFPMFEYNDDEQRLEALHHPFTAPIEADLNDPETAISQAYDIVLDGVEIGGGSIRISSPELQQKVFDAIGIEASEAQERFGFLLDALKQGAPPHGGLALGVDRLVAIIAGKESIRDVIAFPKTASGSDPLTGAPAPVDAKQLKQLGLVSTVKKSD